MRRLVVAATLALTSLGGAALLAAPGAHATGACATVHISINGNAVDQSQCTPAAPAPPAVP